MNPTPKQLEVVEAIRQDYRYILTGGAVSTAKTYGLALIFLSLANQYPKTRYAVCRKNLTTIKRTTYQTFKEVAEKMNLSSEQHYKENRNEMVWNFSNGSQIWFVELDDSKDRDFNKIKGLELTAAGIDECNEVTEEAFNILSSRVGRQNYKDEPEFVLLTCNPSDTWVKERFYTPHIKNELEFPYLFIPSLPADNPHNKASYLKALQEMPDAFRKRYVEGNWDYVDENNALFPTRVVDKSLTDTLSAGERYIGVDVAREGADETVFALIENNILVDLFIPNVPKDADTAILDRQAQELIGYAERNRVGFENIIVDAVGLGGGLIDSCKARGWHVKSYKSGSTKDLPRSGTGQMMTNNLRSATYWKLARALDSGAFQIYNNCNFLPELKKDFAVHTYEVTDTKTIVESKKDLKKRLGKSPDFSDAVVMAHYLCNYHEDRQNASRISVFL